MACTSRKSWFGRPPEADFSAATASSTAENRIDCITSLAALCMVPELTAGGLALCPSLIAAASHDTHLPKDAGPRKRLRDLRRARGAAVDGRAARARRFGSQDRRRMRPADRSRAVHSRGPEDADLE